MGLLNREALLKKGPRRTKIIPLPELGGEITIRAMSEGERSRYEMQFMAKDGTPKLSSIEAARRRLIVACVVDENGNAMLTEADLNALAEQDASALSRIYNEARDFNGFSEQDIEELTGNFSQTSGTSPPTDSQNAAAAGM